MRNINLGGAKVELAGWVRNLTQNREATFALTTLNLFATTTTGGAKRH
jgi:hypothetical protein